MTTGLDDFHNFVQGYKGVLSAALGGALITLTAELSGLTPPFPNGVIQITAVFQLMILILVYQIVDRPTKKYADRQVVVAISAFVVFLLVYVFVLNVLSYADPDGERKLKGFSCTETAIQYFKGSCPFLSLKQIRDGGGIEGDLWTESSRAASGMVVFVLWTIMFSAASFAVAVFSRFQRSQNIK